VADAGEGKEERQFPEDVRCFDRVPRDAPRLFYAGGLGIFARLSPKIITGKAP